MVTSSGFALTTLTDAIFTGAAVGDAAGCVVWFGPDLEQPDNKSAKNVSAAKVRFLFNVDPSISSCGVPVQFAFLCFLSTQQRALSFQSGFLCAISVFSVPLWWNFWLSLLTTRDTEHSKVAQKRATSYRATYLLTILMSREVLTFHHSSSWSPSPSPSGFLMPNFSSRY